MRITVIAPPSPRPAAPSSRTGSSPPTAPRRAPAELSPCAADYEVVVHRATATFGDLHRALGGAGTLAGGVVVDGRPLPLDHVLDDELLRPGSVLTFVAPGREIAPRSMGDPPGAPTGTLNGALAGALAGALRVVGGLDAGATIPLSVGDQVIGRDASCAIRLPSPTVSRHHARLTLALDGAATITDLGATNGVDIRGELIATAAPLAANEPARLGATSVAVGPVPPPAPPMRGARSHNRPPRVHRDDPTPRVHVPVAPRALAGRTPFSWAMLLAPLAVGLVMALLFSPMFAVFAVLSPVMMVGAWFEQRHRRARERRRVGRVVGTAMARFGRDLRAAADAHTAWLRDRAPDLAALAQRLEHHDPRLWERRPAHDDFGVLRLGCATRAWAPSLDVGAEQLTSEVAELIDEHAQLHRAPVTATIGPGLVVGITGASRTTRAVARALVVQAAILHGPADLWTALATTAEGLDHWAFLSWLPHHLASPDPTATRRCVHDTELHDLAALLAATGTPTGSRPAAPCGLVIVDATRDGPDRADGEDAPRGTHGSRPDLDRFIRSLPARHSAIVLVSDPRRLPATCTTVIECLDEDGTARVTEPRTGAHLSEVLLDGLTRPKATEIARRLRGIEDPEVGAGVAPLPADADLAELLVRAEARDGDAGDEVARILDRWCRHGTDPGLPAVVGVDAAGPHVIDLVADGPHALIGGTTGSGKSELLQTWVIALAATHGPDRLTFVLVDYKGGSAFDRCAALPHVVGVVTDLDEQLGRRALRSLDAEIRRREQLLRGTGVADIDALRIAPDAPGLPRLVVIIDEFATLAADLPGFLDALVGVAQRGRSLGLHLVLATQRPHGAINDNIRTNTNLRIALRMLDAGDSIDVLGTGDATTIDRRLPGRALSTVGGDAPIAWHAARVDAAPAAPVATADAHPVVVTPLDAFGEPLVAPPGEARPNVERTGRLVAHVAAAFRRSGLAAPSRPWLPALPAHITPDGLRQPAGGPPRRGSGPETTEPPTREPTTAPGAAGLQPVPLGLTDEPDRQRQQVWRWHPAAGPLVVYGMPGTGKTTAALAAVDGLARSHSTAECHVYAVGASSSALLALAELPQVGAVITSDERARLDRLLRWLEARRQERARTATRCPAIVVVVDGAGALLHALDDLEGRRALATFLRLASDGPRVGLHLVMTGDRPQAIPAAVAAATDAKVVLRLPDPYDYSLLGIRPPSGAAPPGRGVLADGTEIQIAHVRDATAARAGGDTSTGARPAAPVEIGELPDAVALASLPDASIAGEQWRLPLGLDDATLDPIALELATGDHLLVAGPPGSGRSTALLTFGCAFEYAGLGRVLVLAPRPSALTAAFPHHATTPAALLEQVAHAMADGGADEPILVLVDDADLVDDDRLPRLLGADRPTLHLVAAGRTDRLRRAYAHWTRPLRDARLGLALDATATNDGDLWNVRLPIARPGVTIAGRGVLVRDGIPSVVQVAHP